MSISHVDALLERLDALYEKATKGTWRVHNLHRVSAGNITSPLMSYLFGPLDDSKQCVSLGSENESDHHLVVALHEAYPLLRQELESLRRDAGRLDWFEHMADKGCAPSLVYDDNGMWAVAEEGAQNVREQDTHDFAITHFVEAHKFKRKVRDAIDAAIDAQRQGEGNG